MGNRRLAAVAISDDEDDDDKLPLSRVTRASSNGEDKANSQRKRKKVRLDEEEEEEEEEKEKENPQEEEEEVNNVDESRDKRKKKRKMPENEEEERGRGKRNKKKKFDEELEFESEPEPVEEEEVEVEEEQLEDAKPIGEVIRVTGKGKGRRNHYESFEYDGNRYELEDPVLLVPEAKNQKPYVAIIKDITQTKDGNMMVTGQWFYRPEEAQRRNGGNWQSRDTRELFYSFHRDEVPAESVMHKCVVHFVPLNKQIPGRKEHPGFIVQKVYDTEQMKLFKLTDKDYEDTKQQEIDLLVQKTIARVGHLADIEIEDNFAAPVSQEDQLKSKRLLRKKSMTPLDVTREDEAPTRLGQSKAETPGSCPNNSSEYFIILSNFNVLTGETQRDKWLEKLLQSIQFLCNPVDNVQNDGKEKGGSDVTDLTGNAGSAKHTNESLDDGSNGDKFRWPDSAVPAVVALEKAAHEALSYDFQKYNQKMRQLTFNLKNNSSLSKTLQNSSLLARRLLNGELDPSQILNMSPNELKEGLTAEEIASREPEEPEPIQMTDARCKRCTEKKVRLMEIIQAGHGDRYQLECIACGNTWYASRDEAASLTIDGPNFTKSVGTEPLATAKFEDVENNLTSPRRADKGASDVLKKTTEAYMPVLDSQRSFNKSKTEDNTTTSNAD